MLPSRGLRPAQLVPRASRHSQLARSGAPRQFSSLPRTAGLSTLPSRKSPLQAARWRAGATANTHAILPASSVRYGSWYAPWSWGKSSTPSPPTADPASVPNGVEQVPIAEFSHRPLSDFSQQHAAHVEPAVTSSTPELAPAGIDKPATVTEPLESTSAAVQNTQSSTDQQSLDELLRLGGEKDVLPKAEFDPTQLIDHAGQLKELGLDYGWGMTTLYEKLIEQIYLQTGWGWAGSIVSAGVVVRMVTFYFQAKTSNQMATMAALAPLTKPLSDKMEAALARGDKHQADLYKMQQNEMMKPYMGGMLSTGGFMFMQAWIGFAAFRFLRAMAELPVPGMNHDGFLWFSDLATRDPYFILPALTTSIMYLVFKKGGETGIQTAGPEAAQRQTLFTAMAFMLGIVTAFQASALQLYFLTSATLGGLTGYLLRQNGFRRMIGIRAIPSQQSNELYSKVLKGDLKLQDIKASDSKMRYQAPRPVVKIAPRRTGHTLTGIKIKEGAIIPAHLRVESKKIANARQDRDVDFEEGPAGKPLGEKLDFYRRNYRVSYVWRRFTGGLANMAKKAGYAPAKMSKEQERRKRRAEEYEVERRRRFENSR
ncbi:hypothetical protein ACN47E_008272 [Coniothyrium glycines]